MKTINEKIRETASCIFIVAILALAGCESLAMRQAGFEYGGYKAASAAIEHRADNVEAVVFIAESIKTILNEESMLFTAVEQWYADQRKEIEMDPLDRELLETLVIKPLWSDLKAKYGGNFLQIQNPQVKADLIAFRRGLITAVEYSGF